ncbi:DUF4870 domain-containing protein [Sporosarcina sp. ANT_H38]|uniref:DUF4870 domain-containing protein n=1 Tax=Sporosarcina sp. ANT_H38 TaxID=2597358 RepID=UPI0011F28E4B|nr:DUF4870 domain-containing protein [Sporosarcina sp. ANT_H38]KAA0965037.1 DUF4870 domain-containing protein [Sporosarcina sp. ANT_H38]
MENKGLKVLVHASAFFMPFLVPFIIYLVIDDLEVKRMAIQAVLFQLVMSALIFVSALLIIVLVGIPMLIGFGLMWIIVPIIAIVKALKDEKYNYPIVGRWI